MSAVNVNTTLRTGHVTLKQDLKGLYRQTRHTTSNIDSRWLWARRNQESVRPLVMEFFFGKGQHVDFLYMDWNDLDVLCKTRCRLSRFFQKVAERCRQKRASVISESLSPHLCEDVIHICVEYAV